MSFAGVLDGFWENNSVKGLFEDIFDISLGSAG
jgi:hypothetical protein